MKSSKAVLLLVLGILLVCVAAASCRPVEACPDCDVKYDIEGDKYIYADGVFVDSDGDRLIWWSARVPDCEVVSVCVSTDAGLVWPEPVNYGSWEAPGKAYHAVICGSCNEGLVSSVYSVFGQGAGYRALEK